MGTAETVIVDIYSWLYVIAGALLLSVEVYCIKARNKQTISHKLIRWQKGGQFTRRLLVAAFLFWLFYHLSFEYF